MNIGQIKGHPNEPSDHVMRLAGKLADDRGLNVQGVVDIAFINHQIEFKDLVE